MAKVKNIFVAINPLECRVYTLFYLKTDSRFVVQKKSVMEIYNLPEDVRVFGFTVKSFPAGIGEAFESLIKTIPGGFDRPYYGISYLDENGHMIYKATALEKSESEAQKYNYERITIQKGEYLTTTVYDWRKKTAGIKDVFSEILQDSRADKTKPAIEWYKNNDEMMCMVQTIIR